MRAVQEAVSGLTLDAVDLQIAQVRQAGGTTLPYDYDGQRLRVTFPEPLQRGAPATVEVDYVSRNRVWGSISSRQMPPTRTNRCRCGASVRTKTRATGSLALTHRTKSHDRNDRDRAAALFCAVQWHALVHHRDEAAGTITYHWLQDQPHSTYLMTLVVGEFSERRRWWMVSQCSGM